MIFHIDPVPCPRPRVTRWGAYYPPKYTAYKEELTLLGHRFKGGDKLMVTFFMPMAKSWSKKKKKEMDGMPHQQKPDLDNLCKGVMDCLWEEDSHIHQIHAEKVWSTEGSIEIL